METTDDSNWGFLRGRSSDRVNFRTVEFHEYSAGGQLTTANHYDAGSLLTLDIMLSAPSVDFDGGAFVAPLADGSCSQVPGGKFDKGDAIIFLSHKYHNIEPVTRGTRVVLVAELWEGPEKECPHRCNTTDACTETSDWFCDNHCGFTGCYHEVEEHELGCPFAFAHISHPQSNRSCFDPGGRCEGQRQDTQHDCKRLKRGHINIKVSGSTLPCFNGLYREMPGLQNSRCHYRNEHGKALFYYDANEGGDAGWSFDGRNVDGELDVFDGGFLMSKPGQSLQLTPPLGRLFWQGRLFKGFLELASTSASAPAPAPAPAPAASTSMSAFASVSASASTPASTPASAPAPASLSAHLLLS
jgi:hypothetical protein